MGPTIVWAQSLKPNTQVKQSDWVFEFETVWLDLFLYLQAAT